ncbi:MAG: hypothetical protein ACO1QB_17850 [Verrucomicrobiales bacterium]
MPEFEFISPDEKAALLAISSPEMLSHARLVATDLGYKLHQVTNHEQFVEKFAQLQYELVLLDELFEAAAPEQNLALASLQSMQMPRRRHATIILFGNRFETLHAMEAYQNSVHAVVNWKDIDKLKPIVQQVVTENSIFLSVFKDVQSRLAQGKR